MSAAATTEAERTLERLRAVQANFEDLANLRRDALLEALQAGNSLRAVGAVANCSYESVRRLAGPNAAIFEWGGGTYVMTEHVTRVLEYKASGFAKGAFPADVAAIGAGTAWLRGAAELARELQRVQRGDTTAPVSLNEQTAYALYLILTRTHTGRPSRLADLYDELCRVYG
jgi:hypothetical protein